MTISAIACLIAIPIFIGLLTLAAYLTILAIKALRKYLR